MARTNKRNWIHNLGNQRVSRGKERNFTKREKKLTMTIFSSTYKAGNVSSLSFTRMTLYINFQFKCSRRTQAIKLQEYVPVINYIPSLASDSNQINFTRKKETTVLIEVIELLFWKQPSRSLKVQQILKLFIEIF